MDGVNLTPLKQIHNPKGNIFHAMASVKPLLMVLVRHIFHS